MATEMTDGLPVGIKAEGGVEFACDWGPDNTDVVITFDYPDYSGWTSGSTEQRDITISQEDWQAIVSHIAAEVAAKKPKEKP